MVRIKPFALVLASLLSLEAAGAQAISGRIMLDSASEAPAARALVVLLGDSAQVLGGTHADPTGVFGLTAEHAGSFRLAFFPGGKGAVLTPPFALESGAYLEREFRVPPSVAASREILLPTEVTKRVLGRPGNPAPEYPGSRASRGARGLVRVLLVVNEKGEPEMETAQVIGATDPAFVGPVLRSLAGSRFFAAERDGKPVAQLTERTFDFGCPGDPDRGDVMIRSLYSGCAKR